MSVDISSEVVGPSLDPVEVCTRLTDDAIPLKGLVVVGDLQLGHHTGSPARPLQQPCSNEAVPIAEAMHEGIGREVM